MEEVWKVIEGFEDYKISSKGRVGSYKGIEEIILTPIEMSTGYLYVNLYKYGEKPKHRYIHRLMYENFIEKIPKGCVVHHRDENKLNNILENFQCMAESEHHSLHTDNKGEKNPRSRLKEQDVIEIKRLCDEGILTQREIGYLFGVSKYTISDIKLRKRWKHI